MGELIPSFLCHYICIATYDYFLSERDRRQLKLGNSEDSEIIIIKKKDFYNSFCCPHYFVCISLSSPHPHHHLSASGATKSTLITFYSFAMIGAVVAFLLNHRLQHYKTHSFRGVMKAIFNCIWEAGHYY